MVLPPKTIHSVGEDLTATKTPFAEAVEVDTFDGKLHIEWDPTASVTPIGQLPFFIEFLKLGNRFEPWIKDCPLVYTSHNAPTKTDVLGTLLLSVLSGHTRYAHITTLMGDTVNSILLGMNKIVSDDSARRALKKIDEVEGVQWLQQHLYSSYGPLLNTPWILDVDVTVKPLYGHQQGAKLGYNPHKPGRPSHTYHTYMIANLRLVLNVEVQAGDQAQSAHSLPGLMSILNKLPLDQRPTFVRGDCDWGSERVMSELEEIDQHYLFKLKKSKNVKALINKHHCSGEWTYFKEGWEAKTDQLQLQSWEKERRVVIVRRRVSNNNIMGLELGSGKQQKELAFVDGPEDMKLYEYSVLITSLAGELVTVVQHYRDRADCENVFDEIKNQWGWGGFTTHDLKSCQFISRIIALVYNWWSLFVRLAHPEKHYEAITSRPLLLSSVGRLTKTGRQQKMIITSSHSETKRVQAIYRRMTTFFSDLKSAAPQLTPQACWEQILAKAMTAFSVVTRPEQIKILPLPT
ncbi:MAG: transposase [Gammaproteobacteria bacterium]|nr:transposase [Gammaproteobacteria bacterium]